MSVGIRKRLVSFLWHGHIGAWVRGENGNKMVARLVLFQCQVRVRCVTGVTKRGGAAPSSC